MVGKSGNDKSYITQYERLKLGFPSFGGWGSDFGAAYVRFKERTLIMILCYLMKVIKCQFIDDGLFSS